MGEEGGILGTERGRDRDSIVWMFMPWSLVNFNQIMVGIFGAARAAFFKSTRTYSNILENISELFEKYSETFSSCSIILGNIFELLGHTWKYF